MERCLVAILICITLGGCKIYTRTEGQGLILSPDNNFFCQNNSVDCVEEYDSPRIQTLNALPAPDYTFSRWNGCTYTAPNTCQTSITQDAIDADAEWTVTATFEPRLITPREATYTYNAHGQRITKTVDSVTTLFQYDMEGNLLAELDVSGQPIKQHVYINGEPIAVINQNPVQDKRDIYYVHTDHLGTPSLITSGNATIVADYDSTPFGEVQTHYDEIDYNKRFPGQYRDDESGLHYNYFRDYDRTVGRYIQSDPIGLDGGLNTYTYVGGSPTLRTDEFGLAWPLGEHGLNNRSDLGGARCLSNSEIDLVAGMYAGFLMGSPAGLPGIVAGGIAGVAISQTPRTSQSQKYATEAMIGNAVNPSSTSSNLKTAGASTLLSAALPKDSDPTARESATAALVGGAMFGAYGYGAGATGPWSRDAITSFLSRQNLKSCSCEIN